MNPQNQGSSVPPAVELLGKRKRGRPRKDENQAQGNSPAMPKSDGTMSNQHVEVAPSATNDDDMVGQVVSGVVEGTFDAGYFLSVKVGNTDTLLRGVVFQQGRFTPISEANDVAPQAKMYKRKNIPIPVLNRQTQINSSTPRPKQNNEQPIQFAKQAPVVPGLVTPSKLPPNIPHAPHKQCVSVVVNSTGNFPMNSGLSVGKNVMPPKISDSMLPSAQLLPFKHPSGPSFSPVKQPVPVGLPKNDSSVPLGRNIISPKTSESELPSTQVLAPELTSDPSFAFDKQSAPHIVTVPKNDSTLSLGINAIPTSEPELPAPQLLASVHMSDPLSTLVKQSAPDLVTVTDGCPKNDLGLPLEKSFIPSKASESEHPSAQGLASELASEPSFALEKQSAPDAVTVIDSCQKNDLDLSLGEAVIPPKTQALHDAVGSGLNPGLLIEAEVKSPNLELHLTSMTAGPKTLPPEQMDTPLVKQDSPKNIIPQAVEGELADKILEGDETSENGKPVRNAADNIEGDLQSSPKTTQPEMILQTESVLPGMLNSQVSSLADPTKDVDHNVLQDAVPPPESCSDPVVSNSSVENGDSVQN
ncbi:uncharacterized protein LOC131153612 [Malania oleifera]|uniref:uncharacterized protein LOC131153612 n=1 Tax=Malania oleifera TaxID=397392 RepID=UPI0025AE60EF|nr:uncharacterized protein LOC131153612 [Malania oleifera]